MILSPIDATPLIRTLQRISSDGRARHQTGVDDEAVQYARRANFALLWLEADQAGNIEAATRWLEELERS